MRKFGYAIVASVFAASLASSAWGRDADDVYRRLAVFARVLNYVEHNYVQPVDTTALVYGAIRGMLATLDPHSGFMEPEQYRALKNEAQGAFGGIGVELVKRPAGVTIVECFDDAPAQRAGLQVGDRITAVDDTSVSTLSLSEIVRRIKGVAGTTVQLEVLRARQARVEQIRVVRDQIQVAAVIGETLGDGYGYIRIRTFSERTSRELEKTLSRLRQLGVIKGLVLDLRDNPGGLLDEAVRVSDTWLRAGVIVSTEGRHRDPEVELAHPKGTEPGYPIVLLVNGGTASASEIVAGAMQDHDRGVVLGTQTFGKGSVQTMIELEDGSALKLTIARYFTPDHRSIQGSGITPDVVVPREPHTLKTSDDVGEHGLKEDNQVQAALAVLRRWSVNIEDSSGKEGASGGRLYRVKS